MQWKHIAQAGKKRFMTYSHLCDSHFSANAVIYLAAIVFKVLRKQFSFQYHLSFSATG